MTGSNSLLKRLNGVGVTLLELSATWCSLVENRVAVGYSTSGHPERQLLIMGKESQQLSNCFQRTVTALSVFPIKTLSGGIVFL